MAPKNRAQGPRMTKARPTMQPLLQCCGFSGWAPGCVWLLCSRRQCARSSRGSGQQPPSELLAAAAEPPLPSGGAAAKVSLLGCCAAEAPQPALATAVAPLTGCTASSRRPPATSPPVSCRHAACCAHGTPRLCDTVYSACRGQPYGTITLQCVIARHTRWQSGG